MVASVARAAGDTEPPSRPTLQQAIDGAWRTLAFVRRDGARHPVRVLKFFGLKRDMTVIELDPGGGWWTEILAPYLGAEGRLLEAIPPASSTGFMRRMRRHFIDKLKSSPALYGNVRTLPFAPPDVVHLGPRDSADLVLTFRNLHDWKISGGLGRVFRAAFKVLRPGGVFGVVSHRALPAADPARSASMLHRLPEDFVIQLGLDAGFRLAAVSEVNANPRDPLTINVHHLPPDLSHDSIAEARADRKIGESDRMTLRFVKPGPSRCVAGGGRVAH